MAKFRGKRKDPDITNTIKPQFLLPHAVHRYDHLNDKTAIFYQKKN